MDETLAETFFYDLEIIAKVKVIVTDIRLKFVRTSGFQDA